VTNPKQGNEMSTPEPRQPITITVTITDPLAELAEMSPDAIVADFVEVPSYWLLRGAAVTCDNPNRAHLAAGPARP
jgi:hypothetical protein